MILPGRFVPVVAVRQVDGPDGEKLTDLTLHTGVGDPPQGGGAARVVCRVKFRRALHHLLVQPVQLAFGVAVDRHDGADVGGERLHQPDPVLDGRRLSELVGQNLASGVVLQAHRCDEPDPDHVLSAHGKAVAHHVIAGLSVLAQHSILSPAVEKTGGRLVLFLGGGGPVQTFACFQVDDIVFVLAFERLLGSFVDHVVGWA